MTDPAPNEPPPPRPFRGAWVVVPLAVFSMLAVVAFFVYRALPRGSGAEAETFSYRNGPADGGLPSLWSAPSFSLSDEEGHIRTQRDLAGHVWIADFFYTTCTSACPTLSAKLVLLQRELPEGNLRFVSFSVDPLHDTPGALAAYRKEWGRDDPRWMLLQTTPVALASVSAGMRVSVDASGDARNPILHTTLLFLVDREGKVRGIYDSSDAEALARLKRDARKLVGGPVGAQANAGDTGAALFSSLGCAGCHDQDKIAPSLAGMKGRTVALEGGGSVLADTAYIRESLLSPGAKIAAGYLNLMPSYDGHLSGEQLQRLVDYVAALGPATAAPGSSAMPAVGVDGTVTAAVASAGAKAPSSAGAATPTLGVDPVCGMKVRITKDTPEADYRGHAYHFCSESCRDKFVADSARYAKDAN